MAKNKTPGDDMRVGAVKKRSQTPNPITGTWTKRSADSGKFMDVKADPKPFVGVRKEKKAAPAPAAKAAAPKKAAAAPKAAAKKK